MERKVHIQFNSTGVVTLTTFSHQKAIDLSDFVGRYIDLITFKKIKEHGDEHRFIAYVEKSDNYYLEVLARQRLNHKWEIIGTAELNNFRYHYNSGNKHEQIKDGVFKIKVLD